MAYPTDVLHHIIHCGGTLVKDNLFGYIVDGLGNVADCSGRLGTRERSGVLVGTFSATNDLYFLELLGFFLEGNIQVGMGARWVRSDVKVLLYRLVAHGAKDKGLFSYRDMMDFIEAFFIGRRPFGGAF